MKKDLFHNASLRLTATYLLIITIISLLFSVGLYRVSSSELERSLRRPASSSERRLLRDGELRELLDSRENELANAQDRLRASLLALNLLIFCGGGFISYYLARRTLRPIENAHAAQSRFTADASHELRTPITVMRVETELTLTDPKLTLKKATAQLKSNIEELDKLTALSEGLLQLARLEGDSLELQPHNLDSIVDSAVARIKKDAKKKSQIVKIIGEKGITVNANQAGLTEALVTLLDNAVRYSPKNTAILIAKNLQQGNITLAVSDSGPGISPRDLPHIFERFYRGDSSRSTSGYGIGLSLAQTLIEAHGGTISADNAKNGAVFTITLPL